MEGVQQVLGSRRDALLPNPAHRTVLHSQGLNAGSLLVALEMIFDYSPSPLARTSSSLFAQTSPLNKEQNP
jgi:hypothetical protein